MTNFISKPVSIVAALSAISLASFTFPTQPSYADPHGGAQTSSLKGSATSFDVLSKRYVDTMHHFGSIHGKALDPNGAMDPQLASIYYDGPSVYLSMQNLTHDKAFYDYAVKAAEIYMKYVSSSGGNVQGFRNFTDGMTHLYEATTDASLKARLKSSIMSIVQNGAYVKIDTPDENPGVNSKSLKASREVAYAITALLNSEKLGAPRSPRLAKLISFARGHLDQYSDSHYFVKPFMIALTGKALIQYMEEGGATLDEKRGIVAQFQKIATKMIETCWDSNDESMKYIDKDVQGEDPSKPTKDLNNLIAPLYGYVWYRTGDVSMRNMYDSLFEGGLTKYHNEGGRDLHDGGPYIWDPKQFMQNAYWAEKGMDWRSKQPTKF